MDKLIGLEDLPDNFKVYLEDNFRQKLLKISVAKTGGFIKLSKLVKFDWSSLCKLRRGYRIIDNRKSIYFIKLPLLSSLLKISGIDISKAKKYVIGLATNKILVKTRLPICSSPKLASIIGHAIGDGHVSKERFKYVNKRKELIDEVKGNVKEIFGCDGKEFYIKEKDCYGIQYPAVIGKLLGMLGAPLGRKVMKEFDIPIWIKNGSDDIKSAFLRALFDDEGSVISTKYNFISISMYKDNSIIDSHIKFLNEIRELLLNLNIKPQQICFKKNYNNTKGYGFRIGGKDNLNSFLKNISFKHLLKQEKLIRIINKHNL